MPKDYEDYETLTGEEELTQATGLKGVKDRPPPEPTPPAPSGTTDRPQWQWVMQYLDPAGYKRTMPANSTNGLCLSTAAWPPNYRVPNGQPGGGYPASGSKPKGNEPIRLVPVERYTGRLIFVTQFKLCVYNPDANVTGSFSVLFGTTSSSANISQPLFPYLGVAHDSDLNQMTQNTVQPRERVQISGFRLDIVDDAFSDVPNWPNWEMVYNTTTTLLRPAINPIFRNSGPVALEVSNIHCIGWGS